MLLLLMGGESSPRKTRLLYDLPLGVPVLSLTMAMSLCLKAKSLYMSGLCSASKEFIGTDA